jgi:predicted  nucleic acid-binding Zn-ribbon protein
MKSARVFFLVALTLAGASGQSPIGKVIELLSSLEAQIQKEGEESAKLNSEKEGWCKDTAVNLGFEIETGSSEVEELKATIGKEAATIATLASKVEDLAATIAKDDKDLVAATKIRVEEAADFATEEKELTETISAVQRAIGVLQREMAKTGGAAFVQVNKGAASVIQALQALVKASAFSAADANTLASFVQNNHEAEDSDEEPGAPEAATYKSKSGSIVDVLEDLLDKANEQLDAARKKEVSAKHNFQMLAQSLRDEIEFSTKGMGEAKKSSASSAEAKAEAEGALAAASKDLAGDKAALEELRKDCAAHADDYAAESKSRAEELKAVQEAKKVLSETTGGAGGIAYGLSQTAPSFLQLGRSGSALRSGADLANLEVVRLVRELGRKYHSPALAQLAKRMSSAMRFSSASGEDPFEKVKSLIGDMIQKLEADSGADAKHKEYCDTEMSDATAKQDEKTAVVEKLTTKINQMTARSSALKDSIATLQKELSELAASQAEMDKMRAAENELFLDQKKELTTGISGVQTAMKTLREYYGGGAKDHAAASDAGAGIIGLLEVCLSDFTKSLAEATATEDSAASAYSSTTMENKIEKTAKDQDVKYQMKEAADLDKAVVETTSDRASTQEELDAVLEYLSKLKDMCVAKPETYAERADRRAAEISGLKQALSILEGEALLIQRKALRGRV